MFGEECVFKRKLTDSLIKVMMIKVMIWNFIWL